MPPDPYIRFRDPDDGGLRPIPAGVSFYATPAIRIIKPAGMGLDPDPAKVYADVDDQFVHVEVGNRGNQDANATVTVWACGFSTAPMGYAGTLGGVNGRSKPVTIPANSPGDATFVNIEWKPQAGEIGAGPELHCCVRANVFVDPNDQEPDPAGTAPDIDVPAIIRHAQRNMTLLPKPSRRKAMRFAFAAGNPGADDDTFVLVVREDRRRRFTREDVAHLRRTRWIDRRRKGLVLTGTDGELTVAPARAPVVAVALEDGEASGKRIKARLKPGELRDVELVLDLEPGDDAAVHRFDIVQLRGRVEIGAVRVLTINVPEKVLERVGACAEL